MDYANRSNTEGVLESGEFVDHIDIDNASGYMSFERLSNGNVKCLLVYYEGEERRELRLEMTYGLYFVLYNSTIIETSHQEVLKKIQSLKLLEN